MQIVNLQMKDVQERLSEQGNLTITLTEAAQKWLAEQGFDNDFGARPLKRAIQRFVESPLSVKLLKGEFSAGDHVYIDEAEGELTFTKVDSAEILQEAEVETAV
jgi:ATP-dependent Clp protease ATP-binding subunit ClpC